MSQTPEPSVASRAATGVAWNTAASVSTRALGLIGTLIVTRFVAPSAYGEYAVAITCVTTATRFVNFGLGPAVISLRATPAQTTQAFACHVGTMAAALLAVIALRGPLGVLLGTPEMGRFIPPLALAVLVAQIAHIPSATLFRDLRFRLVAVARGSGELAFTIVSVLLAPFIGIGGLVAGTIVRSTVVAALVIRASGARQWLRPPPFDRGDLRRMYAFGLAAYATTIAETVSSWDKLIVTRFFGPTAGGYYSLAFSLADTPASQVAEQIGDVLLPSFVALERGRRAAALLRSLRIISLIIFPLAGGMAAVSATLVGTVLHPRWAPVAPMLVILSLVSMLRPMSWTLESFLQAQQRPRALLFLGLFRAVGILIFLFALGRFGLLWACGAVVLGFASYLSACLVVVHRSEGLSVGRFLGAVIPPLCATALMATAVLATRAALRGGTFASGPLRLGAEIAVGGIVYMAAARLLAADATVDLYRVARGVVLPQRRTATP